jgi:hypothetical protein
MITGAGIAEVERGLTPVVRYRTDNRLATGSSQKVKKGGDCRLFAAVSSKLREPNVPGLAGGVERY